MFDRTSALLLFKLLIVSCVSRLGDSTSAFASFRQQTTTQRLCPALPVSGLFCPAKLSHDRFAQRGAGIGIQPRPLPLCRASFLKSSREYGDDAAAADTVKSFFSSWNERDMDAAAALFSEDCSYEDTQYSSDFQGRPKVRQHFNRVAKALPKTFSFVVDDISSSQSGENKFSVGVRWHVENDGEPLPFTRGCSMYNVVLNEEKKYLITRGFDVPEPAPFKQVRGPAAQFYYSRRRLSYLTPRRFDR